MLVTLVEYSRFPVLSVEMAEKVVPHAEAGSSADASCEPVTCGALGWLSGCAAAVPVMAAESVKDATTAAAILNDILPTPRTLSPCKNDNNAREAFIT